MPMIPFLSSCIFEQCFPKHDMCAVHSSQFDTSDILVALYFFSYILEKYKPSHLDSVAKDEVKMSRC